MDPTTINIPNIPLARTGCVSMGESKSIATIVHKLLEGKVPYKKAPKKETKELDEVIVELPLSFLE
jgi:hypothetical protein